MIGHTPGPWTVEWPPEESALAMVEGPIIRGPEGQPVAEILSADLEEESGRFATHDAALVHASPDLLEALKDLSDEIEAHQPELIHHPTWGPLLKEARAAIAKATGGSGA